MPRVGETGTPDGHGDFLALFAAMLAGEDAATPWPSEPLEISNAQWEALRAGKPVVARTSIDGGVVDADGFEEGTPVSEKLASALAEKREFGQEWAEADLAGDSAHAKWAAEQARNAQLAAVMYTVALHADKIGHDMPPPAAGGVTRSAAPRARERQDSGGARRGGDSGDSDLADESEPPSERGAA